MITVYEIGPRGEWTGETQDIVEGVPYGWTDIAPPDLQEGERAVWSSLDWQVTAAIADTGLVDAQASAKADIDSRLQDAFNAGFVPSSGPLAGLTLQCRNNTDRTNWLTSQGAYSLAVASGQGAVTGAMFRTAENETIMVTYAEGLGILVAMAAWGAALYANCWRLKDAVTASTSLPDLATIDLTSGW